MKRVTPMRQHAVGEVFEAFGKKVICEEKCGRWCSSCAFGGDTMDWAEACIKMVCEADKRSDDMDVIYKEVK